MYVNSNGFEAAEHRIAYLNEAWSCVVLCDVRPAIVVFLPTHGARVDSNHPIPMLPLSSEQYMKSCRLHATHTSRVGGMRSCFNIFCYWETCMARW